MAQNEIWQVHPVFDCIECSNLGHIRNSKTKKLRKLTPKDGYYICNINGKLQRVHRLVAQTFIPNPENKPFIDHINTVRNDNRIENLRWCTYYENNNNPISRQKSSISLTGKTAWNKGKTGVYSEETIKKISDALKGRTPWNKGIPQTESTKKKISAALKARYNYS